VWARCAHELGEVARFGFSELKEAARVSDAGAMQIQLRVMRQVNFFGAPAAVRQAERNAPLQLYLGCVTSITKAYAYGCGIELTPRE